MRWIVTLGSIILYLLAYFLIELLKPPEVDHLRQLHAATADKLHELVQTKFFRIIRLNLQQECPLSFTRRICKSTSCHVCRCDEKDIPSIWMHLDRASSRGHGVEEWAPQRQSGEEWIWHVEDEENDEGEYFDVSSNVESYTNYNGSAVWQLVYEQSCFGGNEPNRELCEEEQLLYRIVSGLHTSISTHLSTLYAPAANPALEWARPQQTFVFNESEYRKRVMAHPERFNNMLFLY
jgi:ERO1-like protein alpha